MNIDVALAAGGKNDLRPKIPSQFVGEAPLQKHRLLEHKETKSTTRERVLSQTLAESG